MRDVVSFSGGRSSAHLVWLLRDKADFIFMDTGAEHPKTYKFIKDIVEHWGIRLTVLRVAYNEKLGKGNDYEIVQLDRIGPDLDPWYGMVSKYGCPSVASPYCTSRMKTEIHDKYCNSVYGKGNYITWIGIRADEQRRIKDRENVKYLAQLSDFDKHDILDWWKKQPFNLEIPEYLGNCVFCIKKGLNKVALAAKAEPELAQEFIKVTEGDHVRTEGRKHQHKRMYRKSLHLSDVIKMYEDTTKEELENNLRQTKRLDAGGCSESCEVFETMDLFDDK